jgi:hypothetical protein
MWPRPLGGLGSLEEGDRGLLSFLGIESGPIIALLPDLQICKFVKPYAHRRVNLEAVAASSSASSEATDGPTGVGASTLLVGGFLGVLALLFCGLLFFTARLRLIFAFRFLAM